MKIIPWPIPGLILAVITLLALTPSSPEASAQDDAIQIAWIPKALDNPVFELGRAGCETAAAKLSATTGRMVECLYMGSETANMAEQARVIEAAIAQGVDAIGVSCNHPIGCIDPINAAIEAGIPVMTWDSDAPASNRLTYLSINNYDGGRAAANILIREMGASGEVALLTGVPGAFNLEERLRGFTDGIAGTDIEITATAIGNDDIARSAQVVEETMQTHPDLDGWFFAGGWPVLAGDGAMPRFEDAALNGDLKAVAFDTLPAELEWLKDGRLDGLVGQKYWGWGYDTITMLVDHLINGTTFPAWTDSGMDIVTIRNVDAMAEAWETQDFTQMLPLAYPPADGKFSIAWIPKALDEPGFELGRAGCEAAAAEAAERYGINIECLYMATADMVEQARAIKDAIAQGVDVIGVNCYDPTGCIDPINAAIEAGIPVMTWDTDSPGSGRFTYLGVSNYEGGKVAADLLIREMGTSGKVALLTGVPGAFHLEERIRGFKDGIASTDIEIVAAVACNDDMNLSVQVVEATMQAHPDLDGWFLAGGWPILAGDGAMPLFEEAALNGDMKVVAFNSLPVALEWLRDGRLHGLVGQKYWRWGYNTVFIGLNHAGFLYPYPKWTDSGFDIVTIHNVDALADAWETQDFTQPLPPPY